MTTPTLNKTMTTQTQSITTPKAESSVEFTPFGSENKIKLSVTIVKNLIAVPTRSGKTCSDRDAMRFLMLCQSKELNPFSSEAYLIGFDGKEGPQFSMFVAHAALLMRAEADENFDGMESGAVLVPKGGGDFLNVEGDLFDETQFDLVGGWARVTRKNRKVPVYRRVALKVFAKNYGVWQLNPSGMIVKCAEADALRSAYPARCGSLYTREEGAIEVPAKIVAQSPSTAMLESVPAQEPAQLQCEDREQESPAKNPESKPDPKPANGAATTTPQLALKSAFEGAGLTFMDFVGACESSGSLANADSFTNWDMIPNADAVRLAGRALKGLLAQAQAGKGGLL